MKFLIYPALDEEAVREIEAVSGEVECLNVADESEALVAVREADALYGRISPEMLE